MTIARITAGQQTPLQSPTLSLFWRHLLVAWCTAGRKIATSSSERVLITETKQKCPTTAIKRGPPGLRSLKSTHYHSSLTHGKKHMMRQIHTTPRQYIQGAMIWYMYGTDSTSNMLVVLLYRKVSVVFSHFLVQLKKADEDRHNILCIKCARPECKHGLANSHRHPERVLEHGRVDITQPLLPKALNSSRRWLRPPGVRFQFVYK